MYLAGTDSFAALQSAPANKLLPETVIVDGWPAKIVCGDTANISHEDIKYVQKRFVGKSIPEGSSLIDIEEMFRVNRLGGVTQLRQK